jgi:hypothetical protein
MRRIVYPTLLGLLRLLLLHSCRRTSRMREWENLLEAAPQRNAQNIVSVYGAAVASGRDDLKEIEDVQEIIERLTQGVHGAGTFADSEFRISRLDPTMAEAVENYIVLEDGVLIYSP